MHQSLVITEQATDVMAFEINIKMAMSEDHNHVRSHSFKGPSFKGAAEGE
jgi:hypothetical protein